MNGVDAILNIALLFLWIDWRTGRGARTHQSVLSLASAVRPVERRRRVPQGYGSLAALGGILLIRPLFYCSIGAKVRWTPELDLIAFSIPWRSDLLELMFLFSLVSFLMTLGFFYCAILLFSAVNQSSGENEVMRHFVRLQLGWFDKVPASIKLLLPILFTGLGWIVLAPVLARTGLIPSIPPPHVLWAQALALGLASLLAWKWIIAAIFLLHLLNVHVYLGTHPVWGYISQTARRLLVPFRFMTLPKLDLAPIAGLLAVFALADFVVEPAVLGIFHRFTS